MEVFCTHHKQYGTCNEEDYNDAKTGKNPSRMVNVVFKTFTQSVPFHTLNTAYENKYDKLFDRLNESLIDDYPDESGDYDFYDDESNFMPDLGSK